jgi:hypothetical protein
MRRSLSILAAAAIAVGAAAATLSSAQAATPLPAPVATSGDIIEVGGRWENFHGDRHNAFRDDGWNRRHFRRYPRFRHHGYYPRRFHFGFPFAFRPLYYPYRSRYSDCFRTWDGQLICRY